MRTLSIPASLALAVACLLGACARIEVREPPPSAPPPDPNAGLLTLPSGEQLRVLPRELKHTGTATFRWPSGAEYDGDWVDGQPHGIGTMAQPDGERYSGSWQNGQRHGHGELTRADGSHYVGEFVMNARHGNGAQRSKDGLYRGAWHGDLPHGQGEFFGSDGSIYRGYWDSGVRHGSGSYRDPDGSTYEGDWAADEPHGFGRLTGFDGSRYEGSWSAGQRDGYGKARDPSGRFYEGTWRGGQRQGFGKVTRPDGTFYRGEWLAGKRHGQGRETAGTGEYHEGTWELDEPLGPGTRTDTSGIAISGVWNRNTVSNGLLILPTGNEYAGSLFGESNTRVSPELQAWLKQAADRGDPYAHLFLGRVLSDFASPQPDPGRAEKHFAHAAAAGLPEAQFRLARILAPIRPARAIELLTLAADKDHAAANTLLGEWYLQGRFVPADAQIARRFLLRGTQLGDLRARNALAWMLATRPPLKDAMQAIELIESVALFLQDWQHLDTLAAAYAARGDFENAVSTARSALEDARADPAADEATLQQISQRLEQYRDERPFEEYIE